MSILDQIKKLFGGEDIPEEAAAIYRMSKDERDALNRVEAERGRSDRHRETLIGDVKAISEEEERLTEAGRGETSAVRRRILAKQVVEIRGRIDSLMNRIDILTRRISVFDRQSALLRDRAVFDAPLPERGEIQQAAEEALIARREFEEVADLADLHAGVSRIPGASEHEREVIRELEEDREVEVSFDEMLAEEQTKASPRKSREAMEE